MVFQYVNTKHNILGDYAMQISMGIKAEGIACGRAYRMIRSLRIKPGVAANRNRQSGLSCQDWSHSSKSETAVLYCEVSLVVRSGFTNRWSVWRMSQEIEREEPV